MVSLIPRSASINFQKWAKIKDPNKSVLLVEGARQVGKTSLLKSCLEHLKDVTEINLETNKQFRHRMDSTVSFKDFTELLLRDTGFQPKVGATLFIDEAQESEHLGSYVRSMKEEWRHANVVLSGSSMKRLFRKETRVPVGRVNRLFIAPFNFQEFLLANGQELLYEKITSFGRDSEITPLEHSDLLRFLDRYIEIGGLPAVVVDAVSGKQFVSTRKNIFLDQQEDFIRKELFEDGNIFEKAFQGIANILGYPSVLKNICVNYAEARKLSSLLKQWHLVHEIEQKSISSTSIHHSKRYIYDLGIAQDMRAMPFPSLSTLQTVDPTLRGQLGGILENYALLQLHDPELGLSGISGWKKDSTGQIEVDFVLRTPDKKVIPIEVKSTTKITPRHFSNLRQYMKISHINIAILVSCAPFKVFRETNDQRKEIILINLPLYAFHRESVSRLISSTLFQSSFSEH